MKTLHILIRRGGLVLLGLALTVSLTACAAHAVQGPTGPRGPEGPQGPAGASSLKVLLAENFAQPPAHGWNQVRGGWEYWDSKLYQTLDDAKQNNSLYFYEPLKVADAEMSVTVKTMPRVPRFAVAPLDSNLMLEKRRIAGAGIVFRFTDENNYYMFRMAGEEGVVFGKMVNGEWVDLENPRAQDFLNGYLKMDQSYVLRVRFVGSRFQCWVDDKAVVNREDASFSTGRVGLATFRSQGEFSRLEVTER
jgi:hypothetical protein